ncbi:hypothetical protein V2J09_004986 [Rumex salicifolius]
MLAVFAKSVAKSPEGLKSSSQSEASSALKDNLLLRHFSSINPDAVSINLGPTGFIVFTSESHSPLLPRMFAAVDDIFCLFQGNIENMTHLKQQYGLTKTANEVSIIIEAYRSLRDRGPNPADHALRNIEGKFAFIVYDSSTNCTFIAVDADGSVPLFWGTDSEDNLVLSDDLELVKKTCGRSLAPFPKGCFFTSSGGLKSFEHPLKELKPVQWTDSSGQSYGATFIVDADSKKEAGMPRVGSDADWASPYFCLLKRGVTKPSKKAKNFKELVVLLSVSLGVSLTFNRMKKATQSNLSCSAFFTDIALRATGEICRVQNANNDDCINIRALTGKFGWLFSLPANENHVCACG